MGIPFPDLDPYEILEVDKSSSPIYIKKAYKKLCLKYHPDKLQQQQDQQEDSEIFTKIQFAFSILNDPIKRQRYDTTGSLDEYDADSNFNWKDYFDSMNEKITIEMIEEDKLKYQNSGEEKQDIISNFTYYEGDFLKLFELIPHLEFTETEEQRIYKVLEDEIPNLKLDKSILKSWEKYTKSRKTKVKQMLKKLAKEAKEAEELEKQLKIKDKSVGLSDLSMLIKKRQSNRLDDLINSLESKYSQKRGKKRTTKELDDDEFEKIQNEIKRSK
ncbi:unnamed protein product [Candida verbasci]|uniref:J domain-containing protein n=1 Tax=Candida verbasci TaxID=1227364 RepID=A0A9W4TZ36_9ASCO|nr:unnamed protein product [Candida verbasci]